MWSKVRPLFPGARMPPPIPPMPAIPGCMPDEVRRGGPLPLLAPKLKDELLMVDEDGPAWSEGGAPWGCKACCCC